MKKTYKKWLTKGMTAIAFLCTVTACNDTWDEHYDADQSSNVKENLWQQMAANSGELSDFMDILEKTHYYTSATKKSSYTYKELLTSSQAFTVWAPKNGTFSKEDILQRLEENEYAVGQDFIRNHISYYRRNVYGDAIDTLTFLSKKIGIMENSENAISIMEESIALEKKNIPASNGILHILEKPLPYQSNIYEFIYSDNRFSTLKAIFEDYDTAYLNEYLSTVGPPVDGKVTYADSVMTETNRLFSYSFKVDDNYQYGMNAYIETEDSLFAMILPTNAAWEKATEKVSRYFKYRKSYVRTDVANPDPYLLNPDSMQEKQNLTSILRYLTFNARYQEDSKFTGMESFKSGKLDSLTTTSGQKLREREEERETGNGADNFCNRLFANTTPEIKSNGTVFVTDDLLIDPFFTFKPDITYEGEATYNIIANTGSISTVTVDENKRILDEEGNPVVSGKVSRNRYVEIRNGNSNASKVTYKFNNTLAGKYRLYVVLLPEGMYQGMVTSHNKRREYNITASLKYHNDKEGAGVPAAAQFDEMKATKVTSDLNKVDTVDIFGQDIEFPISYYGVNESAVEFSLTAERSRTNTQNTVLYIDKLILKSVDD